MTDPTPAPGWYPAPHANNEQRYWDGAQWLESAPQATALGEKKLNILALVSMIVAVVGFIFACIPGALIVGWILLPIAFVLSIVSLFLKGDKKWFGIVGLILSIVGTIVGVMVFIGVIATAADEAFGGSDTTVTAPSDQPSGDEGEQSSVAPTAEQGTRESPYPVGSEISTNDWTVVINSVNRDGNAVVSEANQFNSPAAAGTHYEIVNYTVTYKGAESGYSAEVALAAVTSSGNVVNSYDSLVSLTDDMGLDELYAGGTLTGSAAFAIPDGETYTLRVRPGIIADEVFVQP
ncbi:DUF2510 domain-containing protein [Microbacterium sp. OVT16B]|jgi:hypothetical protein|uniref:DUF2510 domain-containing protein n=1 Tax=Microbacterium sp. OVT16B TaxID=2862682 RepID=UPI001CC1B029|nr:DUF2510 domain-containing protein [Microbacterium sp. OVT16B]